MRGHFITASAAMAAGLTAGLVAGGAPEVSASDMTRPVHVVIEVPNTNTDVEAIWASAEKLLCSSVESKAGFNAGECSVEVGTVFRAIRGETTTQIPATFLFGGTWSKNAQAVGP